MNALKNDLDQQGWMRIAVDALCASNILPFDLYLPASENDKPSLYRRRSYPLTQDDLERLSARGVRTVYILSGDCESYRNYLRAVVSNNGDITPARRYRILREAVRDVLSESLTGRDAPAAVRVTSDVCRDMVQTICDSQLVLPELLRLMSYDYSTFSHAINVSTYCLLIANRLRMGDEQALMEIGQGALLHDIGKRCIPKETLDKPGQLTEREQRIVKRHPTAGFLELCRHEDLTWGQLMMVYEHHERCDGRGYPGELVRSEIHEYARLCAIADVTDALMRDRPYRPASFRSDVVEYLDRQAGRSFDEEMTRCWIATITGET